MEIVLKNTRSKYFEIYSLLNFDNTHETLKNFFSMEGSIEAKIFAVNESISSQKLTKLKNYFDKVSNLIVPYKFTQIKEIW